MEQVKVYYFPFELETYVPIRFDQIDGQAYCTFSFKESDDLIHEMKKIIISAKAVTDEERLTENIRMKIEGLYSRNVYFDKYGNIVEPGSVIKKQLSNINFQKLKNMMIKCAKEHIDQCKIKSL